MKYSVIVTYTNGTSTGAVITAESTAAAWETVFKLFNPEYIAAVQIAAILTPERERTEESV